MSRLSFHLAHNIIPISNIAMLLEEIQDEVITATLRQIIVTHFILSEAPLSLLAPASRQPSPSSSILQKSRVATAFPLPRTIISPLIKVDASHSELGHANLCSIHAKEGCSLSPHTLLWRTPPEFLLERASVITDVQFPRHRIQEMKLHTRSICIALSYDRTSVHV